MQGPVQAYPEGPAQARPEEPRTSTSSPRSDKGVSSYKEHEQVMAQVCGVLEAQKTMMAEESITVARQNKQIISPTEEKVINQ